MDCCNISRRTKKCKRRSDGKIFKLPRRFTKRKCRNERGFTMKSSCAPYKDCFQGGKSNTYNGTAYIHMNGVNGNIYFSSKNERCHIKYLITGLPDGEHGFHIHRCGDLTKGCSGGCDHFNPTESVHGGRHSKDRHAGDLGNIKSKGGLAEGLFSVNNISCDPTSMFSIIGRMIIVHENRDDLGKVGNEESLKTGNAGKRIACAVIGRAE